MPRWNHAVFLIAALASQIGEASAFVGGSPNKGRTSTELNGNTKSPPLIPMPKDISYGEESRSYRRTVYSHDDWVKHRSPDRFLRNIVSTVTSGIYKNILNEITFVTGIAAFVVFWNAMVGGYTDFEGVKQTGLLEGTIAPTLTLPMAPFTLSSASLGLLLVFRTNAGFKRWDEARKNWGMNINHTRDLVRMGTAWYDKSDVSPERRKEDLENLSLATWSFVRAMKRHLSPESEDEKDFKVELYEKLPKKQAQAIINAAHRPNRALFDLSVAIENLPMHFLRKNEINAAVTIFEDNLGSSERLLTSPVPLFYSRHTARFLIFWMMGLPFALYDSFGTSWNHIALIPSMGVLAIFLMGIEELANQMEEPFTILPMQAYCDKIYNWCTEIVSWEANSNGMSVREAAEPHTAVSTATVEMPNIEAPDGEAPNGINDGLTNEINASISTAKVEVPKGEAPNGINDGPTAAVIDDSVSTSKVEVPSVEAPSGIITDDSISTAKVEVPNGEAPNEINGGSTYEINASISTTQVEVPNDEAPIVINGGPTSSIDDSISTAKVEVPNGEATSGINGGSTNEINASITTANVEVPNGEAPDGIYDGPTTAIINDSISTAKVEVPNGEAPTEINGGSSNAIIGDSISTAEVEVPNSEAPNGINGGPTSSIDDSISTAKVEVPNGAATSGINGGSTNEINSSISTAKVEVPNSEALSGVDGGSTNEVNASMSTAKVEVVDRESLNGGWIDDGRVPRRSFFKVQ